MNEALIPIWIITEKHRTINCARCLGCKAGLAESCSHIASVLFLSSSLDKGKWKAGVHTNEVQLDTAKLRKQGKIC